MKTPTKDRHFLGVWVPSEMVGKIDEAVKGMDLDRSKYLRHAITEKLRAGNHVTNTASNLADAQVGTC